MNRLTALIETKPELTKETLLYWHYKKLWKMLSYIYYILDFDLFFNDRMFNDVDP